MSTLEKDPSIMTSFMEDAKNPPMVGDIVEGKVIARDTKSLYVDIHPFGTGLIFGREFILVRDLIRKLRVGDAVSAKVVDINNEDGYIELSLKEAKQALIWSEVEAAIKNKTPLELPVLEANKGGLLMTWQGVQGFLPASQLKAENYPRVPDGDKDKILDELRKLVDQKLVVTIIGATTEDGKLIFSEKEGSTGTANDPTKKYKVGDELDGEVTGMVDFGVFVKINEGLEGLVHISEMAWSLVEDPKKVYSVGDKVKVKIIEVKDGKVSLSIKALTRNPWESASTKYKAGDKVKGIIIKFNKHGALASIEEGVAGLIHVSEFENEEKLRESLELGKAYDFRITLFDAKDQKMTLSTDLEGKKQVKKAE